MNKVGTFLIGAPKCGTTSLAESLRKGDVVAFSNRKEIFYFDYSYSSKTQEWYHSQFDWSSLLPQIDATPTYMYSNEAIDRILDYNPQSKFIMVIRNPFDRIRSHFFDLCNWVPNFSLTNIDEDVIVKRLGISIRFNLYRDSLYYDRIRYLKSRTENCLILHLENLDDDVFKSVSSYINPNHLIDNIKMHHENKRNVTRSVFVNNVLGSEFLREISSMLPVGGQKMVRQVYKGLTRANTKETKRNQGTFSLTDLLTDEQKGNLKSDYEMSLSEII